MMPCSQTGCLDPLGNCGNPKPQGDVFGDEASGGKWGCEGGALRNGVRVLGKEAQRAPRAQWEDSRLWTRKPASANSASSEAWLQTLQPPEPWAMNVFCLRCQFVIIRLSMLRILGARGVVRNSTERCHAHLTSSPRGHLLAEASCTITVRAPTLDQCLQGQPGCSSFIHCVCMWFCDISPHVYICTSTTTTSKMQNIPGGQGSLSYPSITTPSSFPPQNTCVFYSSKLIR